MLVRAHRVLLLWLTRDPIRWTLMASHSTEVRTSSLMRYPRSTIKWESTLCLTINCRPGRGAYKWVVKRFWNESSSHRRRESRTRPRACSLGIVSTLPERTSSRLRVASPTQSRSICPSSAVSRICTSRSATSARDSPGKLIACSAICSTVIDMQQVYRNERLEDQF
jgi:hypothetical protein